MPTPYLHQLPVEVLVAIIQNLTIQDVRNLVLTCKTLKHVIINDNAIWRSIGRSRFIIYGHGKNNTDQSWYNRCKISHNWCKAIYRNKALIHHDANYMPWLKFYNTEALLLTVGPELRCYPVDRNGFPNGRCIQWHFGMTKIDRCDKRTDDISRFVIKENLLVCGNRNGSVGVYKVDNISSQPHLIQYIKDCIQDGTVEISAVDIVINREDTYLVTASMNSPIVLFWNLNIDNECTDLSEAGSDIATSFGIDLGLDAYSGAKCIALNENGDKLAIGPDGNSKPIMIDLNVMKFMIKSDYSADVNQIVQDIQWHDENTLCYVTHSGLLQMMDIRTHEVVYDTEDPFQASFYCVKTDGHHAIIAGTSQHSRCVLFDSRKPYHTQLYFTQEKRKTTPVYSLDFDSTKLIAAADRGVAALNFNVPSSTPSRDYSHVYL